MTATSAATARETIEEFLFAEADLIDDYRFAEWLDLFDVDGIYWIPSADGADPDRFVSIIYDDVPKLAARVERLQGDLCWAQEPRSRVRHVIGNVRVDHDASTSEIVVVRSNMVIVESRRQQQQLFTARCEHRLRERDGGYKIQQKRVDLLEADFFLGNLTFLI